MPAERVRGHSCCGAPSEGLGAVAQAALSDIDITSNSFNGSADCPAV